MVFYSAWSLFLACCQALSFAFCISKTILKFGVSTRWVTNFYSSVYLHHFLIILVTWHICFSFPSTRRNSILILGYCVFLKTVKVFFLKVIIVLIQYDIIVSALRFNMPIQTLFNNFFWIIIIPQEIFAKECVNLFLTWHQTCGVIWICACNTHQHGIKGTFWIREHMHWSWETRSWAWCYIVLLIWFSWWYCLHVVCVLYPSCYVRKRNNILLLLNSWLFNTNFIFFVLFRLRVLYCM